MESRRAIYKIDNRVPTHIEDISKNLEDNFHETFRELTRNEKAYELIIGLFDNDNSFEEPYYHQTYLESIIEENHEYKELILSIICEMEENSEIKRLTKDTWNNYETRYMIEILCDENSPFYKVLKVIASYPSAFHGIEECNGIEIIPYTDDDYDLHMYMGFHEIFDRMFPVVQLILMTPSLYKMLEIDLDETYDTYDSYDITEYPFSRGQYQDYNGVVKALCDFFSE